MSRSFASPEGGPLRAAWVAQPVLERAAATGRGKGARGTVIGRFGAILHAEFDGFVVVTQPEAATRMPNGIGLPSTPAERTNTRGAASHATGPIGWPTTGSQRQRPDAGDEAALGPGRLQLGAQEIIWEPEHPPAWMARVPSWTPDQLEGATDRARAILEAAGSGAPESAGDTRIQDLPGPAHALRSVGGFTGGDRDAARGLESLERAVQRLDPDAASESSALLTGRGSGLTPVGDDVLAAAALTVFSLGPALGHAAEQLEVWVNALLPAEVQARTTPISATLLGLARHGNAIGPARALLDPRQAQPQMLDAALRRLGSLGHSTGAAYVNTIGALMAVLAAPAPTPLEKELIR